MIGSATTAAEEVVFSLLRAIEAGDAAALDAIYADKATIWQNFTRTAQPKAANIELLLRVSKAGTLSYAVNEAFTMDGRVFLRHVLTITTASGSVMEIPAAMFVTIEGGQVSQIFEYVDSAQFMVPDISEAIVG